MIALVKEFHAPVNALRGHGPLDGGLWQAVGIRHTFRFAVGASFNVIAVVHVLSHKVQGLGNQFHVAGLNIGHNAHFLKALGNVFRVLAQQNGIHVPGHVPGKVVHRRRVKIPLSGSLDILRIIRCRDSHAAGRRNADVYRPFCILTDGLYGGAVGHKHVMGNLQNFLGG